MKQQATTRFRSRALTSFLLVLLIGCLGMSSVSWAQEGQSLMTAIADWRYPEARLSDSRLNDAATINDAGERTIQSLQYSTVMTSKDSLPQVLEYYKAKLANAKTVSQEKGAGGQSVTFLEDSSGRPTAIHVILVNTQTASTTLVISRARTESETHIAWSRYLRL